MYLFKASAGTIASVIAHQRYAFARAPREWCKGELVLISKNRVGLQPDEKQIQCVMRLQDIHRAQPGEIERYWPGSGDRWAYVAEMSDRQRLQEPFDLEEAIGDNARRYWRAMTFARFSAEDADAIEAYLAERTDSAGSGWVKELNVLYEIGGVAGRAAVAERIEGNDSLRAALRRLHPTHCQLCHAEHFLTKEGPPYFEVHLIEGLCGPGSPATDNCLVLCPTCHRKMHLAEVAVEIVRGRRLQVTVNGRVFSVSRNVLSSASQG